MREINVNQIQEAVCQAAITANTILPPDIREGLEQAFEKETHDGARRILSILLQNAVLAEHDKMALCQDTGLATVSIRLGQQVLLTGGDLTEAINEGIRQGYRQGYFRSSIVGHPLQRVNTGDNTPAVIHLEIVPGEALTVTVFPKGAGSENMGRLAMLKPSDGQMGVTRFILETVAIANANPCPPIVVGVGIGGNMEKAAMLAKKALLRPLTERHPDPEMAALEGELLRQINNMGIGPQGLGGDTTALAVNIEVYPTHIASLPVAVSLNCHSTRRATVNI